MKLAQFVLFFTDKFVDLLSTNKFEERRGINPCPM
jgi:hypothetical protein